jgi:hypothetical protein
MASTSSAARRGWTAFFLLSIIAASLTHQGEAKRSHSPLSSEVSGSSGDSLPSDSDLMTVKSDDAAASMKWYHAPIIVGGTGGSGTRGVEEVLESIGVYMVRKYISD